MNYYAFISLFNGLIALILGLAILSQSRRNATYKSFGVLNLSIAAWAIFYSIWQVQTEKQSALFFMRLTMVGCNFIPAAYLWFVRSVIDDSQETRIPRYFIIPLILAPLQFSPLLIEDVVPRLQFPYWPLPGKAMHGVILFFNAVVVYSFYLLFKAWFHSHGVKRWQLKWILLTNSFMWAGGSSNWFLWYNIPIPPLPNFFVSICLLILAYAIARLKLFDVDTLTDLLREARLSVMGLMASNINHELRNPLYIAKGRIETYFDAVERKVYKSQEEEIQKSREILGSVQLQMERALGIIQRFSKFVKVSKAEQSKQPILLHEVVEDVLSFVAAELQTEKINVTERPPKEIQIFADRGQIEEVLLNLILNACQAMKERGGELAIRAKKSADKVTVEISDTGSGISPGEQRRIFEPFYATKAEGTGLGLYIVRQLIERNEGAIEVQSKIGKGTTFLLSLPEPNTRR